MKPVRKPGRLSQEVASYFWIEIATTWTALVRRMSTFWNANMIKEQYVVGIDEAGRGPLAGPVAVGVTVVPGNFDWKEILPGVNDSKQLSEKKREEIFKVARRLKAAGRLDYAVVMVSAKVIDKTGIVPAVNLAMSRALKKISTRTTLSYHTINRMIRTSPKNYVVKLDGGLKAPAEFKNQETIIKGDSKEKIIGLASIMAKVTRDRYMVQKASTKLFAPYDFATHKGYGTQKHRTAIAKFGLTVEHRKSYCKNIILL